MYQQIIPLSSTQSLVLNWEKGWQNFIVKKDNQLLGTFQNVDDLKIGRNFQIPDFGTVFIRLDGDYIAVWQNGKDLATGLKSGYSDHFKSAYNSLYAFAFLLGVFGLFPVAAEKEIIAVAIFGGFILVIVLLGVWAQKKQVVLPLWIGVTIAGIIGILSVLTTPSLLTIGLFGALIYVLVRGAKTGPLKMVSEIKKVELGEDSPLDAGV